MNPRYVIALIASAVALVAVALGIAVGPDDLSGLLVLAAIGGPVAVAAAVGGRFPEEAFPTPAVVGGATVGPLVSIFTTGIVFGFVYLFVQGFAGLASDLVDLLQVDSRLATTLSSPWSLVMLVQMAAVAPLVEEIGKGLGARFASPQTRRGALLAGVAAGAGFAVVENILYVGVGAIFGGAWPEIAISRMLGAAVHPLASGLVLVGWWDWRSGRRPLGWLKGFLAGAGVHALWNGSIVAITVVETAFDLGGATNPLTTAGLGYMIGLGAILGGVLWGVTSAIDEDRSPLGLVDFAGSRAVAAWTLLTASILVPATVLIVAFPDFYRG